MPASRRLTSLDAFRGAILLFLIPDATSGLSIPHVAHHFPGDRAWTFLADAFSHAPWSGYSLWDLVMPFFLFMVGASMPFSRAARAERGDSRGRLLAHAAGRAIGLIVLGTLLAMPIRSGVDFLWPALVLGLGLPIPEWVARWLRLEPVRARDTIAALWWTAVIGAALLHIALAFDRLDHFSLNSVLPQIGLGYAFAFLAAGRGWRTQALLVFGILAAYWLAFSLYPLPGPDFDPARHGILDGDERFSGFFAHWNKSSNFAAAFDRWFLNLFPRPAPFLFNEHGYQTLSFIPSIATMLLGVVAGETLRGGADRARQRDGLLAIGAVLVLGGWLASWTLCPMVKSIWTPSWTLFSAGCGFLALAGFVHALEVRGPRRWAFPLVVAGRNSIVLYSASLISRYWVLEVWRRVFGKSLFAGVYGPVVESLAFGVSLWLAAWALYRLKVFIRL
jgi:predicted acyltransferase